MRWFADNSELNGIRGAEIPDILLFGGVVVPSESQAPLRVAIEAVKKKFGNARAPVKWNFKDLAKLYEQDGIGKLFEPIMRESKTWRREIFAAAAMIDITVIVSCIECYSSDRLNIKVAKPGLAGFAFSNGLMRFALHVAERKTDAATVVLDWPDGGDTGPYDDEYAHAFNYGTSTNKEVKYLSGPLNRLGFTDSVTFTKSKHSTILQFADLVVGATREFIECAIGKKDEAFGIEMLRTIKHRIRGAPNNILGRGIDVPTGNKKLRGAVDEAVKKHLAG